MNKKQPPQRAISEIAHGEKIAEQDPDYIWGWNSPAGKWRAERRAKLVSDGANLRVGMQVLEIGCGTGTFTEMYARSGAHIVALDISAHLLERARKRQLPADRIEFIEMRFEDWSKDEKFDAVIGNSILHHLDIVPSLKHIYELLKPGGWFSFAEPNMLNPQIFLERNVSFIRTLRYQSPDETAFVRWKFAKHLQEIGFIDVQITPFDWLHPAIPPVLIQPTLLMGKFLEALPFVREFSGSLHICGRRSI